MSNDHQKHMDFELKIPRKSSGGRVGNCVAWQRGKGWRFDSSWGKIFFVRNFGGFIFICHFSIRIGFNIKKKFFFLKFPCYFDHFYGGENGGQKSREKSDLIPEIFSKILKWMGGGGLAFGVWQRLTNHFEGLEAEETLEKSIPLKGVW